MTIFSDIPRIVWLALVSFLGSLRANWGMGIFALGMSVALWSTIVNEQNPPQTGAFNNLIGVQPVSVAANLDVLKAIEPVLITITAPRDVWQQISSDTFKATADLTGLSAGIHTVPVHVASEDGRVRVHDVFPNRITVELDASQSRTVPVRIHMLQQPPFGYHAEEPRPTLFQAVVSGPAQLVSSVESVVANMDLSSSRTDFRETVPLVPRTARGYDVSGVSVEPESALVEVSVIREFNFQSMAVVAEVRGIPPNGFWLSRTAVRPATITVAGPRETIQPLSFLKTLPIDLAGLTASGVRQVSIDLPTGVNIIGSSTVEVALTIVPVRGSVMMRLAPRYDGLGTGRQVTNEALSFELTLSGEGPGLADLSPERVVVMLDLRGLGPGAHRVEPRAQTPPGIQVQSINPPVATIILR